ncbi:hypothetical protein HDU96_006138 [Phlyctochytrium bullatum]|nr:hypothetical protein HDU96_006138 [Phlyctochytrium bullatum]
MLWRLRRTKKQLLLAVVLALVILLVYGAFEHYSTEVASDSSPADLILAESGPEASNPAKWLSKVTCNVVEKSCLINNLHVQNGSLNIYLQTYQEVAAVDNLVLSAGIGWGSNHFRFVVVRRPDFRWSAEGFIPIYVHRGTPPPSSLMGMRVRSEPAIFFSILWNNFFRTLYAGVAAWATLKQYNLLFLNRYRFVLTDKGTKPTSFVSLLQASTPYRLEWLDGVENGIYKAAVLGLSRDMGVAELEYEAHFDPKAEFRNEAFRQFCSQVRSNLTHRRTWTGGSTQLLWKRPTLSLIIRDGETRQIVNEDDVIKALKALPVNFRSYRFAKLPISEQIRIASESDILISMHGAALTHTLFMKEGSYVIELFPFRFRKSIFRNLAGINRVVYLSWQNHRESHTRYKHHTVLEHKMTNWTMDRIERLPITWNNMDSKNFWRNQDTVVNLKELVATVKVALEDVRGKGDERFLVFAPWEQYNNQIVGFKSACAVAKMLGRTLVLPHIGHRSAAAENSTERQHFAVNDYTWKAFEHYFDLEEALNLPCKFTTFDNFVSVNRRRSIGTLHYHHLGNVTSEDQVRDYYRDVAKLPSDKLAWDLGVYFHLDRDEILKLHGRDPSRVLAMGTMFWYFDFGRKIRYPVTEFQDYMDDGVYRQITGSLVFSEKVRLVHRQAASQALLGDDYIAVHIRRGDYAQKCAEDSDPASNRTAFSCIQDDDQVSVFLSETFPDCKHKPLYVMTNELSPRSRFQTLLQTWSRVLFLEDLLPANLVESLREPLDPIETAMIEQLVGVHAAVFVGNMHSSFTRLIVEKRLLDGRASAYFVEAASS